MGVVLPQPISFGKYTLFERIGRGGMADVFKARVQGPAGFERTFVLKKILPHLSDDPAFTRMFIEEAKLAAKLNHPNIVQVFELGAVETEYFMSMEYVRGRDLADTMRTLWARLGPPRPELVAYIGREMCRALAYAHDFTAEDGQVLGMIHRDISPSNVMLSYDGAVKLLDFGIAKALGGTNPEENTKNGTLKGKFAYMAPEQTSSNDVDRRIDIFATGIVLHEILTGRRLFKGENDLQTIDRVRKCEVLPPSLHNPLCPPELDALVLQALSKNPDDRFQSGSEMADALDDVVYAYRFQPTHLSQVMRSLFPADAGVDTRPGALSRTTSNLTGSVSPGRQAAGGLPGGPHAARQTLGNTRSPTIPPALGSTGSYSISHPPVGLSFQSQARGSWLSHLIWGRLPVWAVLMLVLIVGFAFVGGTFLGKKQMQAQVEQPSLPNIQMLDLAFQSSPMGADVYLVGTNEYIGRTPFRHKVEYRDDRSTFVVFRLSGYHDWTQEVNAAWPAMVVLKPLAPPSPTEPTPAAPAKSTETAKAFKGKSLKKKPSAPSGKPVDLFDEEAILKSSGGKKNNPF